MKQDDRNRVSEDQNGLSIERTRELLKKRKNTEEAVVDFLNEVEKRKENSDETRFNLEVNWGTIDSKLDADVKGWKVQLVVKLIHQLLFSVVRKHHEKDNQH